MESEEPRGISALGLNVSLNSGLLRLPELADEQLYKDTRQVAELLDVTVQRVNQCCNDEGLPKHSRNKFYLPDVLNWQKVKSIAERLHTNPKQLAKFGFVDFTLKHDDDSAPLGRRSAPTIDKDVLSGLLGSPRRSGAKRKNKRVSNQRTNPTTKKQRDK